MVFILTLIIRHSSMVWCHLCLKHGSRVWICTWLLGYNNYSSQKVADEYVINVNTMRVIMTLCSSRKEALPIISESKS